MSAYFLSVVGGMWIGLCAVGVSATDAELTPAQADMGPRGVEGVLLLRNKNLLSGQIVRLGERYRVIEPGAAIFVPAGQVWRCCRSREDAYAFLRNTSERLLARDHLELAHWCLRNDMLPQAARELLDARTLGPDLPSLPLVERQLRQQLRLAAADQAAAAAPPASDPGSPPAPDSADGQLDLETPALVETTRAVRAGFARRIQPMLIHSCTTSGCHSGDPGEQFELDRLALAGGGHADLTRRNLAATLAWLDLDHPAESRLVEFARREHGEAGKRSTPLRRRQAVLLIEWAQAVAGVEPHPETVADAQPAPERVVPASYEADVADEWADTQEPEITPRDRFDPAIFEATP